MDQRVSFITDWKSQRGSTAELCRLYGISRKTGYKWINRFKSSSWEGLSEASHANFSHPNQTDPALAKLVVEARRAHPSWGAKKLRVLLERKHPSLDFPAPSTITDILKRCGIIKSRTRRPRIITTPAPPPSANMVNDQWSVDFKGQFKLRDGSMCYPLTVCDVASRKILAIRALRGTDALPVQQCFAELFEEYGLPESIRSDNGHPFAGCGAGRLSSLKVWFLKLGIRPVQTRPASPQDNGSHERMHRVLKAEVTLHPAQTLDAQQAAFDTFRSYYNTFRPHEGIGMQTPASLFRAPDRRVPEELLEPEYPLHWEVVRVKAKGKVTFRGQRHFVSDPLTGEFVGLVEIEEGIWKVSYFDLVLGLINMKRGEFTSIGGGGSRPSRRAG